MIIGTLLLAATNFMFSTSSGAMDVSTLTAKRSLTRTTLTDQLGSLRILVNASISAMLGSTIFSPAILSTLHASCANNRQTHRIGNTSRPAGALG